MANAVVCGGDAGEGGGVCGEELGVSMVAARGMEVSPPNIAVGSGPDSGRIPQRLSRPVRRGRRREGADSLVVGQRVLG